MTNANIVPVGSLTKAFTGVGVLRLYEQGKIGLNDTVDKHVNDILMKMNSSTLETIWKNSSINNVTIYQLLHMTGGIQDYRDDDVKNWTIYHPDEDYSPLDYLYESNKTFYCTPGTCMVYSSIGFELLGLVLA